jgi:cytochrome c
VHNGQLLKASVFAACLVCPVPTLADRDTPPNDVRAFYNTSYADAPQICHIGAAEDGSGFAAFSWLIDLYKEAPLVVLNPLEVGAKPPRANVCLQYALSGEPLPIHTQSMQDIMDHCGLLDAGLQPRYAYQQEASQQSSGLSELDMALIRRLDPKIYQAHCTGCHIRY